MCISLRVCGFSLVLLLWLYSCGVFLGIKLWLSSILCRGGELGLWQVVGMLGDHLFL